jgi:hypothetical protein
MSDETPAGQAAADQGTPGSADPAAGERRAQPDGAAGGGADAGADRRAVERRAGERRVGERRQADRRSGDRRQPADRRGPDVRMAAEIARDARSFLATLEAVASGAAGSQGIALLLLDVAQVCVAGAQLGARTDVVLDSNVEPALSDPPDVDALREGIAQQLELADAYVEVFDPYDDDAPVRYALSDDMAAVALDLLHGLRHYDAGRSREALWWWQFTYLNSWGNHAGAALRALQSLVAHVRLDAVPEPIPSDEDGS